MDFAGRRRGFGRRQRSPEPRGDPVVILIRSRRVSKRQIERAQFKLIIDAKNARTQTALADVEARSGQVYSKLNQTEWAPEGDKVYERVKEAIGKRDEQLRETGTETGAGVSGTLTPVGGTLGGSVRRKKTKQPPSE